MRNKIILLFVVLGVFALGILFITSLARENRAKDQIIAEKKGTISHYTNALNQQVATRKAVQAGLDEIKQAYPALIDSVKRAFNVKINRLESISRTRSTITIADTVIVNDTLYIEGSDTIRHHFKNQDRYHLLEGFQNANNELAYHLEVYDSLTIISHWKSTGWFKTAELYVDAVSNNPYSQITNNQNVSVGQRRKRPFGLGVFVGYSPTGWTVGAGLSYSIIRF